MTRANIDFDFDLAAESAKKDFQNNIVGLLEINSMFDAKISAARQKNKNVIFFTIDEMEIISQDWLLKICTQLLENYSIIDRTLRKTNRIYQALKNAEDYRRGLSELPKLNLEQ